MSRAYCLDCDRSIQLSMIMETGDEVTCPHCDAEFDLIGLNSPAIEWAEELRYLNDGEDDWIDDDDWLDEEDEEWSWMIAKQGRIHASAEEKRRATFSE